MLLGLASTATNRQSVNEEDSWVENILPGLTHATKSQAYDCYHHWACPSLQQSRKPVVDDISLDILQPSLLGRYG